MSENSLSEITRDDLQNLEIKVYGHKLAILRHIKSLSSTTDDSRLPSNSAKLPKISIDMTLQQFRKVCIDWEVYKNTVKLQKDQICNQLYSACENDVQSALITAVPTFFQLTECEALKAIETIVTKRSNPAVQRMTFSNLIQHDQETIQQFLTRLRATAVDCEFSCPHCMVDISDRNIKDQFIRGLCNTVLQADILAKASNLKTVEQIVTHAEAFESALRDQSSLQGQKEGESFAVRSSEYRKSKTKLLQNERESSNSSNQKVSNFPSRTSNFGTNNRRNSQYNQQASSQQRQIQYCTGCGSHEHGVPGKPNRHTACPAVLHNVQCGTCFRYGHFTEVCRRRAPEASALLAHVQFSKRRKVYSSPNSELNELKVTVTPDVIDAVDGYHSVLLDESSRPLTTFITEWGRFMYCRMPQGFVAAGDAYTRRYDEVIADIKRKLKISDDALLYDDDMEVHFYRVWDFLTLLYENGIVASAPKFQFARPVTIFAGLELNENGVSPSKKTLAAIANFPTPTDITGARSWFGLVNQVAWAFSMSDTMKPFRDLIKPKQTFYWDSSLDEIFQASKHKIVELVKEGVRSFDPRLKTCLQTDWSKDGIGYVFGVDIFH